VHRGVGELLLNRAVLVEQPSDRLEHDQRMLLSCPPECVVGAGIDFCI
jgi:hypothetical protein